MEQLQAKEPNRAISQQLPELPIPPEQIWALLTPQQQRAIFQRLVGLCQELLHRPPAGELEVPDERL